MKVPLRKRRARSILAKRLGIAAIVLLSPFFAIEASATALLEASLGFSGYSVPGKWVPLWIRCEEAPGAARIVVTRIDEKGLESGSETFPATGGRIECPVWKGDGLAYVKVRLVSGGRDLAEAKLDARADGFPGHLILACALSARARLDIASALMPEEPMLAVPVSPPDLPANGLDYDGIGALVIDETEGGAFSKGELGLSPSQREALVAWIASGGRLLVLSGQGRSAILRELGFSEAEGSAAYGFGSYRSYPAKDLRAAIAASPAFWREALELKPYDPSSRKGASAAARYSEASDKPQAGGSRARLVIALATLAWILATLAAALAARKKPLVIGAVAALCLAAVLAGGGALDGSFERGSKLRILALALPDSASAYATLSAKAYEPAEPLTWATARAIGGPRLSGPGGESGSLGRWEHELGFATFSLRKGGDKELELTGLIDERTWKAMSLGSVPASIRYSETGMPPEVESSSILAFIQGGSSGGKLRWWSKEPQGSWKASEEPPDPFRAEAPRLLALRGSEGSLSVLAGLCSAAPLGIRIEGRLVDEIAWAMPLPKGGAR